MTDKQKTEVKITVKKMHQDVRITLDTAIWAMKNAGYSKEETIEWMGISQSELKEYWNAPIKLW
jgi:hypothetical protein